MPRYAEGATGGAGSGFFYDQLISLSPARIHIKLPKPTHSRRRKIIQVLEDIQVLPPIVQELIPSVTIGEPTDHTQHCVVRELIKCRRVNVTLTRLTEDERNAPANRIPTRKRAKERYDDANQNHNEIISMQHRWVSASTRISIFGPMPMSKKFRLFKEACRISNLPPPIPFKILELTQWNSLNVCTFINTQLMQGQQFLTGTELAAIPRRHPQFPFCHPGPVSDTILRSSQWFYADSIVQEVNLNTLKEKHYVVHWVGYEDQYNTVEPENNLIGSAILILHKKRDNYIGAGSAGPTLLRRSTRTIPNNLEMAMPHLTKKDQSVAMQNLDEQLKQEENADRYSPAIGFSSCYAILRYFVALRNSLFDTFEDVRPHSYLPIRCLCKYYATSVDTLDFVAYVAKNEKEWRACYVLECGGGQAQDLIATIGQAFELRFNEYVNKTQDTANLNTDKDYYNDLPGKLPPDMLHEEEQLTRSHRNVVKKPRERLRSNLIDLNSPPPDHDYVNEKDPNSNSASARDVFDMQPFSLTAEVQRSQLITETWFHCAISRPQAEGLLKNDGDFLVRESQGKPGQYVLTGLQASTPKHLLLIDPEGIVRTKDRIFDSISHLINYHWTNCLPIISEESALVLRNPIPRNPQMAK